MGTVESSEYPDHKWEPSRAVWDESTQSGNLSNEALIRMSRRTNLFEPRLQAEVKQYLPDKPNIPLLLRLILTASDVSELLNKVPALQNLNGDEYAEAIEQVGLRFTFWPRDAIQVLNDLRARYRSTKQFEPQDLPNLLMKLENVLQSVTPVDVFAQIQWQHKPTSCRDNAVKTVYEAAQRITKAFLAGASVNLLPLPGSVVSKFMLDPTYEYGLEASSDQVVFDSILNALMELRTEEDVDAICRGVQLMEQAVASQA